MANSTLPHPEGVRKPRKWPLAHVTSSRVLAGVAQWREAHGLPCVQAEGSQETRPRASPSAITGKVCFPKASPEMSDTIFSVFIQLKLSRNSDYFCISRFQCKPRPFPNFLCNLKPPQKQILYLHRFLYEHKSTQSLFKELKVFLSKWNFFYSWKFSAECRKDCKRSTVVQNFRDIYNLCMSNLNRRIHFDCHV